VSGEVDEVGQTERQPFHKPKEDIHEWANSIQIVAQLPEGELPEGELSEAEKPLSIHEAVDAIPSPPLAADEEPDEHEHPLHVKEYIKFVRRSKSYGWLLSIISRWSLLDFEKSHSMFDMSSTLVQKLLSQPPLRRMSRRKASSYVEMTFTLDWNLGKFLRDQDFGAASPEVLEQVLCLTGSFDEAQSTTVLEYMIQTWPITHEPILHLLKKLVSLPEGIECSRKSYYLSYVTHIG